MRAVVAFFFVVLLCPAQTPHAIDCIGLTEDWGQCLRLAQDGNIVAQFAMGIMYQDGIDGVVRQNYQEAMKWYRLSADQGNPVAQFNIGRLYQNGRGVPQDYAESFRWTLKAAENDLAMAQSLVGLFYSVGKGVPQDYEASAEWCRKAAEQGNAAGQRWLGMAYELGQGVPQDYVQAHMWLNLASAQGNDDARKDRDKIAAKMTAAQIAEAQRLAREFQPKAYVFHQTSLPPGEKK